MVIDSINELHNNYNPISQFVIRPALKLADAHNHPIRGGIAAALSSGIAHYALIETIGQSADYFLGTSCRDPETKIFLTNLPSGIHLAIGLNMFCNLSLGVRKYFQKKLY